jgi:hypothetical protein
MMWCFERQNVIQKTALSNEGAEVVCIRTRRAFSGHGFQFRLPLPEPLVSDMYGPACVVYVFNEKDP